MNWSSLPLVGRYTIVWIEGRVPGRLRRIDEKLEDTEEMSDMNGVRELSHSIIVPPWALTLSWGRKGSYRSSELRWTSYLPWKGRRRGGRSH